MKGVSVIVPVYNKSLFLDTTLNSLVMQNFKNMELILIDDASVDNSLEIMKHYKRKYRNIRLIKNKSNMGVSYCRNKGIEVSNGKYIGFVDADDFVDTDFFSTLYNSAIDNNNPDIVRGGFKLYSIDLFTNISRLRYTCSVDDCINNDFVKDRKLFLEQETISCCSKIYRSDFLTKGFLDIPFEDEEFTLRNIIKAKDILYIDSTSYKYFMDIGIHYKNNNKPSTKFLSLFAIYDGLFKLDSRYSDVLLDRFVASLYSKVASISNWDVDSDTKFQMIQNIFYLMNYKYPNWKESKCYYLFLNNEFLKKYIKFFNKDYKEDTLEKIKTLVKS